MYVAMTRARNHLAVSYPLNAYSSRTGADYSMGQASRFLDRSVRELMQRVTLTAGEPEPPAPEPEVAPVLDLRALLRGRFTR
jgi:ATP-dependent exoDNAse (exonuclease V) beta subunit